MRRLSAALAAALVVFLAIPRSGVDMPNPDSGGDSLLAALAIGVGIIVAMLVGKAAKEAAGRGMVGRSLVCLMMGGIIVPLCFLLLVSLLYFLAGGPWRAYTKPPGRLDKRARGLRHIGYPESRACALRSSLRRHLWTVSSSVGQAEAPASIPKQPRRVARFTNVGATGQIGSRTDLPHCTSRHHFDVARATRLAPAIRPGELTPGSTSA